MPELLSPAGSLKNMRYAFAYGADAVYAGQPRYSLRVRNNEFSLEKLAIGIDEAKAQGKHFYVVSNVAPHNNKLKTYIQDLTPVIALKPDALIMSDPGLIMMVREAFPQQTIHLSVQANAVNYASVKFWAAQGIKRVILSRELGLQEIEEIRHECPDTELEVFVHGALCMAYSGRCLLSGYMNKRDPNQGACTNACRWQYNAEPAQRDDVGNVVGKWDPQGQPIEPTLGLGASATEDYLITERQRPDEPMTAFEDEHGTYIMNSRDLRAVQHVHALTQMGVDSLKIEGRTKSFYYCARTAQVYRQVINDALSGVPFNNEYLYELDKLANRGYTEGFLRRHTHDMYQNYETGASISDKQQLVGEVVAIEEGNVITVEVKNRFGLGDSLELMTPKGNYIFTLQQLEQLSGNTIDVAPGSGHVVKVRLPEGITASPMSILLRNLVEGETTRGKVA
ncbi:tRNA 5-hydroxyuridine modification protein YegQ [Alteromonas facilis]|uniref:prephenate-dependent tRNA uridine(34) hydroxylase TrhP n=1 Tax=Alteromonas facilis TaxID=2048004 RepID=UPI000C28C703|nr:tRNA 5-hydroxyuridine modification protein YegQ [Alteromonas facilis]